MNIFHKNASEQDHKTTLVIIKLLSDQILQLKLAHHDEDNQMHIRPSEEGLFIFLFLMEYVIRCNLPSFVRNHTIT